MERPFPAYQGDDPYVFVSYAHEDTALVYPEIQWLKDQGFNIWYDEGISPGSRWSEELATALEKSTLFIYFCTPQSVNSHHCLNEVNRSLDTEKPTIAIHLQATTLTPGLLLQLSSHQAILKYELSVEDYRAKLASGVGTYLRASQPGESRSDSVDGNRRTDSWERKGVVVLAENRQTDSRVRNGIVVLTVVIVLIGLSVLSSQIGPHTANDEQPSVSKEVASPSIVDVSKPVPGFSDRAAIAVLPFLNMSADSDQEYFADGVTEDLITGIQSFQSFPVIARTSTFQYKGKGIDVREIAATLGAGYIIEGSVRKVGNDDVRINVQISNHQGQHVLVEKFDFKFADTLQKQDEVIRKILLAIEPKLIISEADRVGYVRTEDMQAWDYYLQALPNTFAIFANTNLSGQPVTREQLEYATTLLHKALDLDPSFAAAYRLLNHTQAYHAGRFRYTMKGEEEYLAAIEKGLEYGEKARQISPFEPSVCSCQSALLLMKGDIDAASRLQQEALRVNPANSFVWVIMAKVLQIEGDYERALHEINMGKRLSPTDIGMTGYLSIEAAIYQSMGQFDKAIEVAQKALLLSPRTYDAEFVRILSLYAQGNVGEARSAVSKLQGKTPAGFNPVARWVEPFPEVVAERITLDNGNDLKNMSYKEGVKAVFHQLGWQTKKNEN